MALNPIPGSDISDIINGTDGDDYITGMGGNDILNGKGGNDTIDGGSGNDTITGGSGTDTLTGGTGVDTFVDTAANLNGDIITDFLPGDRIVLTDTTLNRTNVNVQVSGNVLSYAGGSITINNLGAGRYVQRDITGGGVEIRLQHNAHNDFNGDGLTDILWRNDAGTLFDWVATGDGAFASNAANFSTTLSTEWRLIGTGDFNGDGREDLLWRQDVTGHLLDWLGTSTGAFVTNPQNFDSSVPSNIQFLATGDFNGDGITDILWRDVNTGVMFDWVGNSNGGFASNAGNFSTTISGEWRVIGAGDFNGDGIDDILWRQDVTGHVLDWLGTSTGAFNTNPQNFDTTVGANMQYLGTGDFNGDGITDILWRDSNTGAMFDWLGNTKGGFASNAGTFSTTLSSDWHVISIGDVNGDAIDDLILRQDGSGRLLDWLGTTNGGFVTNTAHFDSSVPSSIHIQDPFF